MYGHDILSRLDDVKARVTSFFGRILKMDSTKKVCEGALYIKQGILVLGCLLILYHSFKQVTRKLAGAAAGTAAWVTNVGNEHGQVLMSVLTAAEGHRLLPMAHQPAGV